MRRGFGGATAKPPNAAAGSKYPAQLIIIIFSVIRKERFKPPCGGLLGALPVYAVDKCPQTPSHGCIAPQIPICASKNYFTTSNCCHNKSHSISDQTSGILWRKTSISAPPFSCGILTGTPNRNRTCNCPLGGGCYIRLTMGAYSQH